MFVQIINWWRLAAMAATAAALFAFTTDDRLQKSTHGAELTLHATFFRPNSRSKSLVCALADLKTTTQASTVER